VHAACTFSSALQHHYRQCKRRCCSRYVLCARARGVCLSVCVIICLYTFQCVPHYHVLDVEISGRVCMHCVTAECSSNSGAAGRLLTLLACTGSSNTVTYCLLILYLLPVQLLLFVLIALAAMMPRSHVRCRCVFGVAMVGGTSALCSRLHSC
jgi:hypothetical protein